MQINSNRPADFYPLVPTQSRNNARLPVIIDAGETANKQLSNQRADNSSVVLAAQTARDGQQARFVRDFISTERDMADSDKPPFLPRSVQQYLFINQLPKQTSSQQGQFLDEMA